MRTAKLRQVVAALIVRDDNILICQRTETQKMPLKWEFPGGKVEPGEQLPSALRRELEEELGIHAEIGRRVLVLQHRYDGEIQNRIFRDLRWVDRKDLPGYDFLEADVSLVKEISAGKIL